MTKKHFAAMAEEIAKISDITAREEACMAVATAARRINGRFDWMKFSAACNV